MKDMISSENPTRDLILISSAVFFITGIILYKSFFEKKESFSSEKIAAEVAVSQERPPTEVAAAIAPVTEITNKMNEQTFRYLITDAEGRLPTLSDLRRLSPDEVHHKPAWLQEAGLILSQIAQALHDNRALGSEAALFYEKCYAREDLPMSVRGICLAHHRKIRIDRGDRSEWTAHEASQPLQVLRLAGAVHL